jgi:hypothetical protein
MKKIIIVFFAFLILNGCVGVSSQGVLGTGVNIYLDPRSLGTQIDDSIMQKSLLIRLEIYFRHLSKSCRWTYLFNRVCKYSR